MPQGRSGINVHTPRKLVFDAGELFRNINLDDLELPYPADPENPQPGESLDPVGDALVGADSLGATRGGATFNPNRTTRNMEADGAMGPVKGMRRRESVEPTLSATLLEMSRANLLVAFAGSTSVAAGSFFKTKGSAILQASYADNIALLATYSGSVRPVVFVLKDVLPTEVAEINLEDQNEPVIDVTFGAYFDPDSPSEEPWIIYHPGEAHPTLAAISGVPDATDVDPTIEIRVNHDVFADDDALVENMSHWNFEADTTALTMDSINRTDPAKVEISFTGTAAAGTMTVQAKAAALAGNLATEVLSIEIT